MASEDYVEKRLSETLTQTNANLHGCADTLRAEFKKAVEEMKEELRNATGAALRQSGLARTTLSGSLSTSSRTT